MKVTKTKAILSGDVIEIFQYQNPLQYQFKSSRYRKDRIEVTDELTLERKTDSRKRSKLRARSWVTKLINSNAWRWYQEDGVPFPPVFITFTFEENLTNISEANYIFTKFIKRLNFNLYKIKASIIQYLTVTEFQKRGAVHFHCLFFNLPIELSNTERETRHIADIWGHGFIDVKDMGDIDKAIYYLTKYMVKNFDDNRLDTKKRYFASRQLHKPIIIRQEHLAEIYLASIPPERKVFEKVYESKYQGATTYMKFKLNRGEALSLKKPKNKSTIAYTP